MSSIPHWKKTLFYILMLSFVLSFPAFLTFGYLGIRKLQLSYEYCGSYGKADNQIGWVLDDNQSSCLNLHNRLSGKKFFSSEIYTNNAGIRSASPSGVPKKKSFVAVGDSWVFGYGVNYEESWPYHLEKILNEPVINLGVPNYSAAQTYLLLKRKVRQLEPKVVIYHTQGMWQRSVCVGKLKPIEILEPCYWRNPNSNNIELITPVGTYVADQKRKHIYPSGIFTAGYDPWKYFLIIRPLDILRNLSGKIFGQNTNQAREWRHGDTPIPASLERSIWSKNLTLFAQLMKDYGFSLVWVDKNGYYKDIVQDVERNLDVQIIYMSREDWKNFIEKRADNLTEEEKYVPKDGHYSNLMNIAIASGISEFMEDTKLIRYQD
tara:strand:- start:2782 stop:3912 length:1131 start_codon:yes stop_codon:yes gene_type:complete